MYANLEIEKGMDAEWIKKWRPIVKVWSEEATKEFLAKRKKEQLIIEKELMNEVLEKIKNSNDSF